MWWNASKSDIEEPSGGGVPVWHGGHEPPMFVNGVAWSCGSSSWCVSQGVDEVLLELGDVGVRGLVWVTCGEGECVGGEEFGEVGLGGMVAGKDHGSVEES